MIPVRNNNLRIIFLHGDNDRLSIQQRVNFFAIDNSRYF